MSTPSGQTNNKEEKCDWCTGCPAKVKPLNASNASTVQQPALASATNATATASNAVQPTANATANATANTASNANKSVQPVPFQEGGKGKKKSASKGKKSSAKKGGALAEDLSRLAVPFGLLLAKHSMQKFLNRETGEAKKEAPKKPEFMRRRTIGGEEANAQEQNGGEGCAVLPKMGGKKKAEPKSKKAESKAKKGGADASAESLLEDLAVPVGLMLAERGTRMYLNREKKPKAAEKKPKVGGKEKANEKKSEEKKSEEKKM